MTQWTIEQRCSAVDLILARAPVLPVIAIRELAHAVPLARALVAGGLPVLEVTLRSPVALAAITAMVREVPGAIIGAGTVLDEDALDAVTRAGARFAISPGCTEALYLAASRATIPHIPAISTASELMRGIEHGHRRFKFFPAESSGGVGTLKSFAGPFAQVKFCPTGGIDAASAPRYLALPNVPTVGGSWMIPADALAAGDFERIEHLARAAATMAASS
ncbi:MAG: bifunctional 4-hydroxy-2-oxoglutarate aldolase/2-dehydro-3-deoxy-phosphogluconate aldolase [Rhodanobacteraceae bacterium]|nr:bifunctional 4-hydroxy-2-oxoglutarate aldolase/2-dehydro-3-deoxy-phosphogluconate aldolase [Rhodanobacteraceae bacterium]MBL0042371.1 bifunctional 4-hydroxy-2-oxoglutarate aldolase/2-dehydro-3-deoxy-phosphogluconate aldolase [Xanthomonadales bacterium]